MGRRQILSVFLTEAALLYPGRVDKLILNGPLPLTDEQRAYFKCVMAAEREWAPRWDGSHLNELWDNRRAAQAEWTNLDAFQASQGGFVFCQVHNIQQDVPVENVEAMLTAAYEYGVC